MLALLLCLPFIGALAVLVFGREDRLCWSISVVFTGIALAFLGWLKIEGSGEELISFTVEWMPRIGLNFSLWLDGPALFWAWLVLGIGVLVLFYAGFYMHPGDCPRKFYSSMMAFMGAMLGLVLSRNVLLMFVFWEMTSLTSFLLIGHWSHKPAAVAGARRALLLTGAGGLCLLAGIAVVYWILFDSGVKPVSLEWDALWASTPLIIAHPAAPLALFLFLAGAFTKSAQFPFHFWLPGAMEAPTPVSALLHAATMVKAGIYLLGRMYPIFNTMPEWLYMVAPAGVVTMIVGGYMAMLSRDIKQLLAYSTVSQLGLLTAYYGFGYKRLGTAEPLTLDLLLIASHALFKGGLFMLCGIVDHGTGTRDWTRLGGLWRKMPWTTFLTVAACLSMSGMPFTLGFVAKKLFLEAGIRVQTPMLILDEMLFFLAFLASILTMAYCIRLCVLPFFGKPRDKEIHDHAHEGSWGFLAAPLILIVVCIVGGLYVPTVSDPIAQFVRSEYYEPDPHYKFAFFKHIDFLFWISIGIYFIGGPGVFLAERRLDRLQGRLGYPAPFKGAFDVLFDKLIPAVAGWTARTFQSPSLSRNLAIIIFVLLLLEAIPLYGVYQRGAVLEDSVFQWEPGHLMGLAYLVGAIVMVFLAALPIQPMVRLLAAGFIGILTGGYFILYKAPDLAITQVLVELAILVMFLLLFQRIGHKVQVHRPKMLERNIMILLAVAGGVLFGSLTYFAINSPDRGRPVLEGNPTHAEFYLLNTKYPMQPGGHSGGGNNAVNVILVDFRGMDTMGEIMVLGIAGLGVFCLLSAGRKYKLEKSNLPESDQLVKKDDSLEAEPFSPDPDNLATADANSLIPILPGTALILRQLSPLVAGLALAMAVLLLFAGHNAPGGGFIAGVLTSIALVPFIWGVKSYESPLPSVKQPVWLLPLGLLLAVGTGLTPVLLGYAFLHSAHSQVHFPLIGDIELASAMLFDLGVYFTVLGAVLMAVKTFSSPPDSEEGPQCH